MTVPPAASDLGWARPETPSGTGVLVVSGSSGRLDLGRAHRFAEVGATALALRWFGGAGPAVPREVPLEIFAAGLDLLAEEGEMRFTQIGRKVEGISQKMLTQTLRLMERDGLVIRTVHPVIPPRVEYRLTDLGFSLGVAFCPVWHWVKDHLARIDTARAEFDARVAEAR